MAEEDPLSQTAKEEPPSPVLQQERTISGEAPTFKPAQQRQGEVEELRRRIDTLEKEYRKDMQEVKELLRKILSHLTQTTEQQARMPTPEPVLSDHGNDADDRDDDDDRHPPPPFEYHPSPKAQTLAHTSPLQTSDTYTSPIIHTSPPHTSPIHTPPVHTSPTHLPKEQTAAELPFIGKEAMPTTLVTFPSSNALPHILLYTHQS